MSRNKMRKLPSDDDTGYLWGKSGKKKAKKAATKKGYLWPHKTKINLSGNTENTTG